MSLTKMRRNMNKAIRPLMYIIAAVFFISCFTLYLPSMGRGPSVSADDSVVARVNGQEIPRTMYERAVTLATRMLDLERQRGGNQAGLREYHYARGQGFESVVDQFLRAQAAEREGIKVSGAEVRAVIDQEINDELESRLDGATPQEKRQYEAQLRSLVDDDYTRRKLLIERLNEKLRKDFTPTEEHLMLSYNEVKTRHILVNLVKRSEAEAKKRAEEVLAKLKAGGDFKALAKEYSDDTNSKTAGGDVGWVTADSQFVWEFTDAARRLKKGETSGLVRTMFGYHILKADDTRSKLPKDIKDPKKKQEYMDAFEAKTIQQRMEAYFSGLRLNAKVEPLDPWLAGYVTENEAMSAGNDNQAEEFHKKMLEALKHYEAAAARQDLAAGPPLYAKLVDMYMFSKQDDKALEALAKVLDSNPSAEAYLQQGEIYERKKDKAAAIKAYQEASKLASAQPWLHPQLQVKFKGLGRDDLAKAEYAKWTEFNKKGGATAVPGGGAMPFPMPVGGG